MRGLGRRTKVLEASKTASVKNNYNVASLLLVIIIPLLGILRLIVIGTKVLLV